MRRLGTLLIVAGVLLFGWATTVWVWQDPFSALYTRYEQHRLAERYDTIVRDFHPPPAARRTVAEERGVIAAEARRYRLRARTGQALGRIAVPRLGLKMVLVNGTDARTLKRGPGRDLATFMPGEGELIYIAGHRTTYLAPFSHIERLRTGDRVTIQVPYGTFVYVVRRHRIVAANDVAVLKSRGREVLILQACHPRFFATHRYLVYATPVRVEPKGMRSYTL
jgi:sortase A